MKWTTEFVAKRWPKAVRSGNRASTFSSRYDESERIIRALGYTPGDIEDEDERKVESVSDEPDPTETTGKDGNPKRDNIKKSDDSAPTRKTVPARDPLRKKE